MGRVTQLKSMADLDSILAASDARPVLIFKHSTT